MGKVSNEAKAKYLEKIKHYKKSIEEIQSQETKVLELIRKDPDQSAYQKLVLADRVLDMVSYYIVMNDLSLSLLGIKNEAFMNDARKGCYKSIIYLEEIVSSYIDVPFSDYEELLKKIDGFSQADRYNMLRKLGFAIDSIIEGFGENSKWKWSFVEIQGRYATVAKNLLDLKSLVAGMDPRADYYQERLDHLRLVKLLLQTSADQYRQKYELTTLRADDFKLAISYLAALRRIHALLGEQTEAEELKKKAEIWRVKMEADSKKAEKSKRSSRLGR